MKTKSDFQAAIAAEISNYPVAAELYRARDPRLLAPLDAMAAMLAMAGAEQDVAAAEPFTKARDVTVLADATAKGVLPFGLATRLTVLVENAGAADFSLATGRRLLDSQGRIYVVVAGKTIPAAGSETVEMAQESERRFDHTVTVTQPFYQIEVPAPAEGSAITGVRVIDAENTEFAYRPEYVNVAPGAKVFHLQSDERQRIMVEFGAQDLAGYAPQAGETFTVVVTDTDGAVTIAAGSQFAFEYSASVAEAGIKVTMGAVLRAGRGALDVPTLRKVSSYPSIYDTSAVYLGNFDFLVRRNLSPFQFLSVWNEQVEEEVRGASVTNVNTLFVAALKAGIDGDELFEEIKALILAADDSYKVKKVAVIETAIPIQITAKIHAVYDFQQVKQQITELVLREYGRDSEFAKIGQNRVLYRRIYSLLTANVPALQGERADLQVVVDDTAITIPPEQFRYVSEASLTVTVDQVL